MTERPRLSALLLGDVPDSALQPIRDASIDLGVIATQSPPSLPLATNGRELNRFIDEATADWILVIRSHERVGHELAREIAEAINSDRAWGYRLLVDELYCGALLTRARSAGEIRLFHRRRARFVADPGAREMLVQGTVVRLSHPLERERFATTAEHSQCLEEKFAVRSGPGRAARFVAAVVAERAMFRGLTTLRYLWVESRFVTDGNQSAGEER